MAEAPACLGRPLSGAGLVCSHPLPQFLLPDRGGGMWRWDRKGTFPRVNPGLEAGTHPLPPSTSPYQMVHSLTTGKGQGAGSSWSCCQSSGVSRAAVLGGPAACAGGTWHPSLYCSVAEALAWCITPAHKGSDECLPPLSADAGSWAETPSHLYQYPHSGLRAWRMVADGH